MDDTKMKSKQNNKNCSRCGNCCCEVFLLVDKAYTEDGLDHLEWAKYHGLKIAYRDDPQGRRLWGVELESPCKHLIKTSDGKTSCAIYENRPQLCRNYNGSEEFPECGYK